jgi:dipeptidyl aminopeptidase/acylaminoacyl peptidase
LDTNVPVNEGRQVVAALEALGREVDYLELEGEGHEYRSRASRQLLMVRMAEFLIGALEIDPEERPEVQRTAG